VGRRPRWSCGRPVVELVTPVLGYYGAVAGVVERMERRKVGARGAPEWKGAPA